MAIALSDAESTALLAGIKAGRYSMLLGAGFSTVAKSRDGRQLPTGGQLVDELADHFGLPRGYSLPRLWGALPTPQREEYLERRFHQCDVPVDSLPIQRFVWRAIWNLNVDDVVETLYSSVDRLQQPQLKFPDSRYSPPETLHDVQVVHLHGGVLQPSAGYVFSTQDYGRSTARGPVWGQVLADALAVQPFIVLGSSLDEYDIEHYLALRAGLDTTREPYPSLLVSRTLDPVVVATAHRYGFIPLESTANEFLVWLLSAAGSIPTPSDLLLPLSPAQLYSSPPVARSFRLFHRQFLYVHPEELPRPFARRTFISGSEPTWIDIEERHDVIRRDLPRMLRAAEDARNTSTATSRLVLLASPPGGGKTTALMRTGYELAMSGVPVFFFTGVERLTSEAAIDCIGLLRNRPVLMFDRASDYSDQIFELIALLNERRIDCAVVACERLGDLRRMELSLRGNPPARVEISPLNRPEALELVSRLRTAGLLGGNARIPDDQLAEGLEDEHLLAAICEATGNGERFDELIRQAWVRIPVGEYQVVMAAVAIAHAMGFSVRFAVAERCGSSDAGRIAREIGAGCLSGLLFREGYVGEYLRTVHRVIAERIVRVVPRELLFDAYTGLARGLAKYVTLETLKSRPVEVRLFARLLDFDRSVHPTLGEASRSFYEAIKVDCDWNSRYWEQVALLELHARNYDLAVANAQHAVGLDRNPLPLTTLGHVLILSAVAGRDAASASDLFVAGIEALKESIRRSQRMKYFHVHPYHSAITGAIKYATRWGGDAIEWEVATWIFLALEEGSSEYKHMFDWPTLSKQWTACMGGG